MFLEKIKAEETNERAAMKGGWSICSEEIELSGSLDGKHAVCFRVLDKIRKHITGAERDEMIMNIFKRGLMKDYEYQMNYIRKNWDK